MECLNLTTWFVRTSEESRLTEKIQLGKLNRAKLFIWKHKRRNEIPHSGYRTATEGYVKYLMKGLVHEYHWQEVERDGQRGERW